MYNKDLKKISSGVTLVEVVIASAIASLVAVFVGVSVFQFAITKEDTMRNSKKTYLAEEGYEMLRFLRDSDWNNLNSLAYNTDYYLAVSTTTLSTTATPQVIDNNYGRNFRLIRVYRNGFGNVVASTTSGAVIDSNAREVLISTYDSRGTTTLKALLMNFSSL